MAAPTTPKTKNSIALTKNVGILRPYFTKNIEHSFLARSSVAPRFYMFWFSKYRFSKNIRSRISQIWQWYPNFCWMEKYLCHQSCMRRGMDGNCISFSHCSSKFCLNTQLIHNLISYMNVSILMEFILNMYRNVKIIILRQTRSEN